MATGINGDATMATLGRVSRRRLIRQAGGAAAGLALTGGSLYFAGSALATTEPPRSGSPEATPTGGTPVGSAGTVTIYSGRNEGLIGDLIAEFERETGIDAEVRYGDTAELAAQILEEGDNSPADVFFSQDAGALGALAKENRLTKLPDELLDRVEARFRSDDGLWVGTSGRARVLVYSTEQVQEGDLPASVLNLVDSTWKSKIGWAPTNGSFQAFVTALRVLNGDDAAREWLEGMQANEPVTFENNAAITRAVGEGELPAGLVNHYYLYEVQAEEGKTFPIANHFFAGGDVGSLVNVAGVGILGTAEHPDKALAFADFLLKEDAQHYFAERTWEYPLIAGVPTEPDLVPLDQIQSPEIDLSDLADLQGTLALLTEVGVL
ncbi:MAG: iron(III) transport system substrate-binding protein [Thermomicrobiales bacterium]|nr:iron(III) transport system substrate-binding protein [Thermomicrobiales bacterium]